MSATAGIFRALYTDDNTGFTTIDTNLKIDYTWSLYLNELEICFSSTIASSQTRYFTLIIESITDSTFNAYDKNDPDKQITIFTKIDESLLPWNTVPSRTVLVYMAADNNLTSVANSNIYSMKNSVGNFITNANLLVFVDRRNVAPALLKIHDSKIDTIATYPEKDSTDPMVLREVIKYVQDNYKSDSYGLVLSSHGSGWLPTSQLHYVMSNFGYAPKRATKAFALEDCIGESHAYTCMELDELAEAIPDKTFDFIAFDVCNMGNIEVVYELRNKADFIISSCYEIPLYGFPYHIITKDLLNWDLQKLCSDFYAYYTSESGQMAGISLVKTEGLDSLARCFRKIVNEYKDIIPDMDVSTVQCFDKFTNHVFYDFEDFVNKLGTRKELLTEFRLKLEECIPYRISTPYIFYGSREETKINSYCGLSIYIPLQKHDASGLNNDYRKTEWSMNTGF